MSNDSYTRRDALKLLGGSLLSLTSCRSARADTVIIGSKNFTEQIILGELLAQQIEAHTSLRVDRRFNLGGTLLCHQALLSGGIDLYPEYTGTALTAVLGEKPSSDAAAVFQKVRDDYHSRFALKVEQPMGFNNTFAIVVRGSDAARLNLHSISDLVANEKQWRAGVGYEFMERPDGYQGLANAYNLHFATQPRVMDLGLLYRALQDNQVDVIAANSTDGLIATLGMVVLADDRHFFPPYEAVTIVREAALAAHPELDAALNGLAGKISEDEMRRMNYAVDGAKTDPSVVVRDFRASHKL